MAFGKRDAVVLLPGSAGAAGLGVLASWQPLLAGGGFALGGLFLLPWAGLLLLMVLFSMIQAEAFGPLAGVELGGFNFSPAHLILIPFAIRAYLATKPQMRLKWGKPEWFLVAFAIIQPLITYRKAPKFTSSLGALGLTALGILAYLAVYVAVCNRRRLLAAARIVLWFILANAAFGIVAEIAHLAGISHIGVSQRSAYGDGVYGLSFEHDIFASTCAVGAIAFYVLWRERNSIMSPRLAGVAFWVCGVASLLGLARGAWLGGGLVFVALMVLPRGGARRIRSIERVGVTVILLSIVTLGGVYILSSSSTTFEAIQQKAEDLVNINTGTGRARLNETAVAIEDWKTSKLFGLGTGTYNQHHPQQEKTNYIGNIYLRALYESGLLGALLLCIFLLLMFWPNRALLFASGDVAAVTRALTFGGAVLLVAYAATDATLFIWPWILFGVIRAGRTLVDREYRASRAVATATPQPVTELSPALEGNGGRVVSAPPRAFDSRR